MVGNMFAMWAVSELITGLYKLTQVSKDVAASASEMGSSFSSTKSDIEDYKQEVEELYETINDSSSSISDVTEARKQLMSIQDELIEKYGAEQSSIDAITKAIKGETIAWEELIKTKWQETKNEFNDGGFINDVGNFFSGYEDNIERMKKEYGEYTATIEFGSISGNDKRKQAEDLLKEFGVFSKTANGTGVGKIELSGNATEVYEQLLKIQDLVDKSGIDFGSSFDSQLRDLANAAKETSTQYRDLYNQFVLNEKILKNSEDGYADSFKNITDKYDAYQNAINSNDEEKAKSSKEDFVKTVTEEMDKAFANGDSDVADYFRNMYPELQDEIDSWNFDVKFETNTDNLKDDVSDSLKKMGGLSKEELLGFNLETATDEQRQGYAELEAVADKCNMSTNELIDKLEILGLVSSESYQNLVDKFGQDAVDKLTPEDLTYAYQIKNVGDMSFEEFQAEIQRLKNEAQKDDETTILSEEELEKVKEQADQLSSIISEIQSSYNTLQSAIEEYNEQGFLSLDTINSLLSLDDEYLACLVDENGQLSLNADAMNALAQAKLNEAEASAVAEAMTELQAIANGEAASSTTNYISGNASLAQSLALLAGQYDNVANAAAVAARAQELSAMIEAANAKDSAATARVMSGLNSRLGLIRSAGSSIKTRGLSGISKSSGSAGKSAEKTMEDIQKEWKEYLDKYLALYKAELEAGLIDFNTFLNKSRSLLDEFYRDGKISAKDYWDSIKSLYEDQLSIYDKVLSAVARRIDKEIDGIQDIIDGLEKQNDTLQKQLDEYDGILSVVDDVYEEEIDRIKEQQEAIDDTISKLQEENDEHKRAIELEKARYQLYKSLNNRNVKLFNGNEFVYTTNRDDIRDAQENLADLELEQTIDGLEKERDALDETIEELEKYRDLWAEISDAYTEETNKQLAIALWGKDYEKLILSNRISDIENFKDNYISIQEQIENNQGLIDSYNEKIEYYEALKEQWSEISDAYEQAQEDQYAAMIMGANWEKDVLSGRLDVLNAFKDQYTAIQQAIINAALESARVQAAAAEQAKNAQTSGGSSGSGGSATTTTPTPIPPVWSVYQNGTNTPLYSGTKSECTKYIERNNYSIVREESTHHRIYVTPKGNGGGGGGASSIMRLMAYGAGTTNAEKGLNLVGEEGTETYIDNNGNVSLVTEPSLIDMEGGETVKNAKETRALFDPSNLVPIDTLEFTGINGEPIRFSQEEFMQKMTNVMPDLSSMFKPMMETPTYGILSANRDSSTSISIGEIHLHEVQNVDGLANAIIRELPNKTIQAITRR